MRTAIWLIAYMIGLYVDPVLRWEGMGWMYAIFYLFFVVVYFVSFFICVILDSKELFEN